MAAALCEAVLDEEDTRTRFNDDFEIDQLRTMMLDLWAD
jgi:hypothetical protein